MPISDILLLVFNIVFVSIPEELFVVFFTLSLLDRYETWMKPNIRKLLLLSIPVVIPALVSNFVRVYSKEPIDLMPLFGVLLISFLIIVTYRIKSIKDIIKCLLFSGLAFVIIMALELLLLSLVTNGTNIPVETFSKLGFINFLYTIPERVVELIVILYMASTQSKLKISILKVILNKTLYLIYAAIILLINLGIVYLFSFSILKNKILFGLDTIYQLLIVTSILIFPVLNISAFVSMIYSYTVRERCENKFVKAEIKALKSCVNILYANGDIRGIIKEVDKFSEFWDDKDKYII